MSVLKKIEKDTKDGGDEAETLGDDVEMGVESQDEQAPGLSGIDVTKVNNPAHTASMTVTTGSKEVRSWTPRLKVQ